MIVKIKNWKLNTEVTFSNVTSACTYANGSKLGICVCDSHRMSYGLNPDIEVNIYDSDEYSNEDSNQKYWDSLEELRSWGNIEIGENEQ